MLETQANLMRDSDQALFGVFEYGLTFYFKHFWVSTSMECSDIPVTFALYLSFGGSLPGVIHSTSLVGSPSAAPRCSSNAHERRRGGSVVLLNIHEVLR